MVNGDGVEHDVVFPYFKAATDKVNRKGASSRTSARCPVTAMPAWRARSWWGLQDDRGGAALRQ